jgi:hypothetical protein
MIKMPVLYIDSCSNKMQGDVDKILSINHIAGDLISNESAQSQRRSNVNQYLAGRRK